MKKYLVALLALLLSSVVGATPYNQTTNNVVVGTATEVLSGNLLVYTSTRASASSPVIQLLGTNGGSATFNNTLTDLFGITAATGVFTGTGNTTFSVTTSSGINVSAGGVTATWFNGSHYGSGAGLTGITTAGGWTNTGSVVTLTNSAYNVVVQSTLTVQGSAFSVGGTTLTVNAGNVGVGTALPLGKLHVYEAAGDEFYTAPNGDGIMLVNKIANKMIALVASQNGNFGGDGAAGVKISEGNGVADAGSVTFFDDGVIGMTYRGAKLGLGTPSPVSKLDVYGPSQLGYIVSARFNGSNFPIGLAAANSNGYPYLGFNTKQTATDDTQTYDTTGSAYMLTGPGYGASGHALTFRTAPTGAATGAITWTDTLSLLEGRVGIGTPSPATKFNMSSGTFLVNGAEASILLGVGGGPIVTSDFTSANGVPVLLVQDTNASNSIATLHGTDDVFGNNWIAFKSRATDGTANTVVQNNDQIWNLYGYGADGATFRPGAQISMAVDGTPGSGDMPGRLGFWTTPDGSFTLIERMRINNAGNVGIGTTTPSALLHINQTVGGPTSAGIISNTSADSAARASLSFYNDTLADIGYVGAHGSQTGPGIGFANQLVLQGLNASGLSIIASNASGDVNIYAGGTSNSDIAATFKDDLQVNLASNTIINSELVFGTTSGGARRPLEVRGGTTTGLITLGLSSYATGVGTRIQFTDDATYNMGVGVNGVGDFIINSGNSSISAGTTRFQVTQGGQVSTPGGLTASSGTFTATGNTQFSLLTSSGINVSAGGVTATWFNGSHYGSGAGLTSVPTTSIAAGTFGSGVLLPAGNLTNGPVASSILPSTVAYTTNSNSFTGSNSFIGANNSFTYGVTVGSFTILNGLTASSGTFTATGNTQYSVTTSSGIRMTNGGCLEFGDGTKQCGAVTGAPPGGAAGLASTQTFTGANTFAGEVVMSSAVTITGMTPILVSSTSLADGFPLSLAVSGSYAYVVDLTSRMQIFDVFNPTAPVLIANVTLPNSLDGYDVLVNGQYAYVSQSQSGGLGGLLIYDISNPSSATLLSSTLIANGTAGCASPSYLRGGYYYSPSKMSIVDIRNPYAPVVVNTTTGILCTGNGLNAIYVEGKYAYAAGDTTSLGDDPALDIYDVSIASNTTLVSRVFISSTANISGLSTITSMSSQGKKLYILTTGGAGDGTQSDWIHVFDVSTPTLAVEISSTNLPVGHASSTNFPKLVVRGEKLYVVDQGFFATYDASNPSALVLVSSFSLVGRPTGLQIQGRYAYIAHGRLSTAAGAGGSLLVLDIGGAYVQSLEAGDVVANNLLLSGKLRVNDADMSGLQVTGTALADTLAARRIATEEITVNTNLLVPSGSRINIAPGAQANFEIMVASQNINASASISTFTLGNYLLPGEVDASSVSWRLTYDCTITSANVFVGVLFNGDNSTNYQLTTAQPGGANSIGSTNITVGRYVQLTENNNVTAGNQIMGDIKFRVARGVPTRVLYYGSNTFNYSTTTGFSIDIYGGRYNGSAALSSLAFVSADDTASTAGSPDQIMPLTCYLELWRNGYRAP